MSTQTIERSTDCDNIEHISTILNRYLRLNGLHRLERNRDCPSKKHEPEIVAIQTAQLEFVYDFENLADFEYEPAMTAARC